MLYDFDRIPDRRALRALKWMDVPQDVIAMSVADMEFPLAPEIRKAIAEAAQAGDFGYVGMQEADYQAVIDWVQRRSDQEIPRQQLIATPGVLYSARVAMYALTQPGDKVVVQPPLHTPSIATASMQGRVPVMNWLKYENGSYTMDFDHLEDCFRQGAKVLMLCAPHNPTGRVWTRDELLTVAQILERYSGWLVCDEIHRDIVWEPSHPHISPSQLPELAQRTVSVFSTSKTFNMGGFHIGSAVIPNAELRQRVVDLFYSFGHVCSRPAVLDMVGQTAAYTRAEAWYMQMMDYVRGNFRLALDYLDGTPIRAAMPEGTFLLWADISELKLDAAGLRDTMLHRWKVLPDPGSYYDTTAYMDYTGPEHHARFNLAAPRSQVEQAFDRIRRSL